MNEIWFDDARGVRATTPPRLASSLNAWYLALGLLLFAIPVIGGFSLASSMRTRAEAREITEGALIAVAPADLVPRLLVVTERAGWVVDGLELTRLAGEPVDDADWDRALIDQSARGQRSFRTTGPDGTSWFHTATQIDGRVIITGRPSNAVHAVPREVQRWSLVVGVLGAAVALVGWWRVPRRLGTSLRRLGAAGTDLRVRGAIRPTTREELTALAHEHVEVRDLANSLRAVDTDSRRSTHRSELLLAAAGALSDLLRPEDVIEVTIDHISSYLGVSRCALLHFDAGVGSFSVVSMRGHEASYVDEVIARDPEPELPSVRAIRDHRPVQISDTESAAAPDTLRERARRHGFRALLAVPLASDDVGAAVLVLQSAEPRTFSFDEVQMVRSLASIAGAALRNARLHARIREQLSSRTSQFEAVVESVDEGLLVESASGEIVYANAPMRRLLPVPTEDVRGRPSIDVMVEVLREHDVPVSVIAEFRSLMTDEVRPSRWLDVELDASGREPQSFRVQCFVAQSPDGEVIGRGQAWRDITVDREIEAMKSDLLAAVSHEFRTPLALIKGYATTLLADDVVWNPAEQSDFLRLLSSEADRLASLVQSLLDMRRIEEGMVVLNSMPTTLSSLAEGLVDGAPHLVGRLRVTIANDAVVDVDPARFSTAVRNLVENACAYSPVESTVDIEFQHDGSDLVVVVRDRGLGIEPALRDRLFEPFVRGSAGIDARDRGIGLGLGIAKGFVEAHAGILSWREPGSGVGSEFVIRVPAPPSVSVDEHDELFLVSE